MATSPRRDNAKPGSRRPKRPTQGSLRPGIGVLPVDTAAKQPESDLPDKTPRRVTLTGRAIALICVLLLVVIFYAPTLRIYLEQQSKIAAFEQTIREQAEEISSLEGELARWDDPAYVRAQARDRLGWVLPGETGFRVVDKDGNVLAGGAEIASSKGGDSALPGSVWWSRMWGSMETADKPIVKIKR